MDIYIYILSNYKLLIIRQMEQCLLISKTLYFTSKWKWYWSSCRSVALREDSGWHAELTIYGVNTIGLWTDQPRLFTNHEKNTQYNNFTTDIVALLTFQILLNIITSPVKWSSVVYLQYKMATLDTREFNILHFPRSIKQCKHVLTNIFCNLKII